MGRKQPDLFAAFGCSACHDEVDGRTQYTHDKMVGEVQSMFRDAVFRTQQIWLDENLIEIK